MFEGLREPPPPPSGLPYGEFPTDPEPLITLARKVSLYLLEPEISFHNQFTESELEAYCQDNFGSSLGEWSAGELYLYDDLRKAAFERVIETLPVPFDANSNAQFDQVIPIVLAQAYQKHILRLRSGIVTDSSPLERYRKNIEQREQFLVKAVVAEMEQHPTEYIVVNNHYRERRFGDAYLGADIEFVKYMERDWEQFKLRVKTKIHDGKNCFVLYSNSFGKPDDLHFVITNDEINSRLTDLFLSEPLLIFDRACGELNALQHKAVNALEKMLDGIGDNIKQVKAKRNRV